MYIIDMRHNIVDVLVYDILSGSLLFAETVAFNPQVGTEFRVRRGTLGWDDLLINIRPNSVHIASLGTRSGYPFTRETSDVDDSIQMPSEHIIPIVSWTWREEIVGAWNVWVQIFDEPIINCMEFTLEYELNVEAGNNVYGRQSVYVRMLKTQVWMNIGTLFVTEDENRVIVTVDLGGISSFDGIGILPADANLNRPGNSYNQWIIASDFRVKSFGVNPY